MANNLRIVKGGQCYKCGSDHLLDMSNRAQFCGSCNAYFPPGLVAINKMKLPESNYQRMKALQENLQRIKALQAETAKILEELEKIVGK